MGKWPKAIFYDSKNTLFDWSTVWVKASSLIVERYKADLDAAKFKETWHKFLIAENHRIAFSEYKDFTYALQQSLIYTFKYFNIPGKPDDVQVMLELWNEVKPFPDVVPALQKQKEMVKILIFSNVETRYLEMMVNKLEGFEPDFVGTMEMARACKPSPRAYYWVLRKTGFEPKDVIYCARPQWDVQGAIACGMVTVWLNRAGEKLEGVEPDYEVKDLHELTNIVEANIRLGK